MHWLWLKVDKSKDESSTSGIDVDDGPCIRSAHLRGLNIKGQDEHEQKLRYDLKGEEQTHRQVEAWGIPFGMRTEAGRIFHASKALQPSLINN
jgi:hypothetical protein